MKVKIFINESFFMTGANAQRINGSKGSDTLLPRPQTARAVYEPASDDIHRVTVNRWWNRSRYLRFNG